MTATTSFDSGIVQQQQALNEELHGCFLEPIRAIGNYRILTRGVKAGSRGYLRPLPLRALPAACWVRATSGGRRRPEVAASRDLGGL
jgi:hypothetical protein